MNGETGDIVSSGELVLIQRTKELRNGFKMDPLALVVFDNRISKMG